MSGKWLQNITHITPGEPVDADVVNRPDRAIVERTQYLKDRLDAAALGQAIFDVDATVSPDVLPGQPVYWNAQTQRYEKALAAVENDNVTGTLVVQPSSDCLGLLYKKKNATLGDVVLRGIVRLPEIANAVVGPVAAGRYFLSSEEPGRLVKQRPPATVSICYVQGVKENCDDAPWVVVMPQIRDFLEDHIHYRFELVPRPAGVHDPALAATSGRHTIAAADVELQGWLPADHASFNGKAPAGAVFGYNLKQHQQLARVWPPQPISAVAMLWDKGQELVGATEIPLGRYGLCVCDANGIWWMSDCYGDVPWPADLDTTPTSSSLSLSAASISDLPPECPREEKMRVIVVYLRMVFGNDRTVVTSLKPGPGSPITVTNCDGLPAMTGDLELGIDLDLTIVPPLVNGGLVFKELGTGLQFRRGWVAEGVVSYPNTNNPIIVNGSHTRPLNPANPAAGTVHQGLITLTFNDQLVDREISPQIIRLSDTVERLYKDIPYLGFPEGQESLLRVRINVPSSGLGQNLQMKIRTQIFGRGAQTTPTALPDLFMSYRILPRPTTPDGAAPDIKIGSALATTDLEIVYDNVVSVLPDIPIEVESEAFSVSEGDTVLVTLRRDVDSYAGEIGLLRMSGVVVVTAEG